MMTRPAVLGGHFRPRILLAGLSLLVLSCGGGDGTGPNPHGGKAPIPAAIGDTLSDQWSNAGDSVRYRVKAATAATLAVYGEAHTAGFVLAIKGLVGAVPQRERDTVLQ